MGGISLRKEIVVAELVTLLSFFPLFFPCLADSSFPPFLPTAMVYVSRLACSSLFPRLLVQPPPLEPAQQDVVDGDVDELDEEADEAHDEEAHGGGVRYPLELCCLLCVVAWRFMVRRWVRRWEGAARVRSTQHTAALAMHAIIDPRTSRAAQARCPALTRCPHAHVHTRTLAVGLGALLDEVQAVLGELLEGLDDVRVHVRHGSGLFQWSARWCVRWRCVS